MAKIHVYVRTVVTGTGAQVAAIADAVKGVKTAVESADGPWNGSATVEPDDVEPTGEPIAEPTE